MDIRKGLLLLLIMILVASVFFTWVVIESKNLVISGMQTTGTSYGKPGLLTLVFCALVAVFALVPRIWAHRICILCSAFNAAWALRNFLMLSTCQGGECPQRQPAFYVYLFSSIALLVLVLVQDVKLPQRNEEKSE